MIKDVGVKEVKVTSGNRVPDQAVVKQLAESMKVAGLIHPILVQRDTMKLLAGGHRLRAAKLLGWETIKANLVDLDALTAELATLDENFVRNKGTVLEHAYWLRRQKEIYEALNPEAKRGGDRRSNGQNGHLKPPSFAKVAAKATGDAERSTRRKVAIADNLTSRAAKVIAKTASADSLEDLQQLAKLPEPKQLEIAERVKKTGQSVREAVRHDQRGTTGEGDEDERFTPRDLVAELDQEEDFTVDAASNPLSPAAQIIGKHWTKDDDGLEESWRGERVFVNPPFSDLAEWVAKADREVREGGCPLVVMLLPAVRTEQPWWQKFIEPFRDGKLVREVAITTKFLAGRTSFGYPGDPEGEKSGSPEFGCVLVTWRGAAVEKPDARSVPAPPKLEPLELPRGGGLVTWTHLKNGVIHGHTIGHSARRHRIERRRKADAGYEGYDLHGQDFGSGPHPTVEAAAKRAEDHERSKFPSVAKKRRMEIQEDEVQR